jgi:hypothetical protein
MVSYVWPMLDGGGEDFLRPTKIAAGIEHALDSAFLCPFLDFVVVAVVRQQRFISLFVGPIARYSMGGFEPALLNLASPFFTVPL